MWRFALAAGVVLLAAYAAAQERPVPTDSTRVAIPGCARGTTFISAAPREGEPVRGNVPVGKRFRLNASKGTLKEIGQDKHSMIEVTGLVRTSQLVDQGVSLMGGRVRIGGPVPAAPLSNDVSRDPRYSEVVLDVESWRPLADSCPAR